MTKREAGKNKLFLPRFLYYPRMIDSDRTRSQTQWSQLKEGREGEVKTHGEYKFAWQLEMFICVHGHSGIIWPPLQHCYAFAKECGFINRRLLNRRQRAIHSPFPPTFEGEKRKKGR